MSPNAEDDVKNRNFKYMRKCVPEPEPGDILEMCLTLTLRRHRDIKVVVTHKNNPITFQGAKSIPAIWGIAKQSLTITNKTTVHPKKKLQQLCDDWKSWRGARNGLSEIVVWASNFPSSSRQFQLLRFVIKGTLTVCTCVVLFQLLLSRNIRLEL